MMSHEQAARIVDRMSEGTKTELALMSKLREMHDEEQIDTYDLKMVLALYLQTTFPKLMMDRAQMPKGVPTDVTGLAVDTTNDDMMAGFFGGMLSVLDMSGMPSIVTDERLCRLLVDTMVTVKVRKMKAKVMEEDHGNPK